MRREQEASHRKRLRRRGAICFVAAPPRCAEASPSSRRLASGPAALATPPHTLFQQPARESDSKLWIECLFCQGCPVGFRSVQIQDHTRVFDFDFAEKFGPRPPEVAQARARGNGRDGGKKTAADQ